MLIDSTHKSWMIGTFLAGTAGLGLYLWLDSTATNELTGGSIVGLWYGIIGSLLMVFAGLLAGHRKLLRWSWIPARSWWLRGHIWLGLLSGVFILCHGGFHWGGVLERVLWVVFFLTLLTGVIGLGLQQVLPRVLSGRVPQETPYEQIPYVRQVLRKRADALVDSLCGLVDSDAPAGVVQREERLEAGERARLRDFYERAVRPFLGEHARVSELARPGQAELVFAQLHASPGLFLVREQLAELEHLCAERRHLHYQEQLHGWLHGWLLVHVPLSVGLLVLGLAHAIVSLYY